MDHTNLKNHINQRLDELDERVKRVIHTLGIAIKNLVTLEDNGEDGYDSKDYLWLIYLYGDLKSLGEYVEGLGIEVEYQLLTRKERTCSYVRRLYEHHAFNHIHNQQDHSDLSDENNHENEENNHDDGNNDGLSKVYADVINEQNGNSLRLKQQHVAYMRNNIMWLYNVTKKMKKLSSEVGEVMHEFEFIEGYLKDAASLGIEFELMVESFWEWLNQICKKREDIAKLVNELMQEVGDGILQNNDTLYHDIMQRIYGIHNNTEYDYDNSDGDSDDDDDDDDDNDESTEDYDGGDDESTEHDDEDDDDTDNDHTDNDEYDVSTGNNSDITDNDNENNNNHDWRENYLLDGNFWVNEQYFSIYDLITIEENDTDSQEFSEWSLINSEDDDDDDFNAFMSCQMFYSCESDVSDVNTSTKSNKEVIDLTDDEDEQEYEFVDAEEVNSIPQ